MPIHRPGRRLMHAIRLPFAKRRAVGGARRDVQARLSLTSMIDLLVVTVVFLLMLFSASSEPAIRRRAQLPWAEHTLDMIDAPIVSVGSDGLRVDGAPAGAARALGGAEGARRIDEVFDLLAAKRVMWKMVRPDRDFPGVVVLQIDQDVPASIVKSVFHTAVLAGYPHVSFMTMQLPRAAR